jgi:hypothetical protein
VSKTKEDWAFVYKCRLCGETERNPFLFASYSEVIGILVDIEINGSHKTQHSGTVHQTSLHTCKNGGVGVSDIQGMVQASTGGEASSDSGN